MLIKTTLMKKFSKISLSKVLALKGREIGFRKINLKE
jgi:hypothetical protein